MSVERSLCKAVLLRPGEVDEARGSVWARDDLSLCWVQSRLWRMCVERERSTLCGVVCGWISG